MKAKLQLKHLLYYAVVYLASFLFLIYIFHDFIQISESDLEIVRQPNSLARSFEIIRNNLINYIGYLITFLLYPLYICLDLCANAWSISISLKAQGVAGTCRHLLVHGMIELPNAILYTYLSFSAFIRMCKEKGFGMQEYIRYVYERKGYYILCFVLVIAAGLAEGLLS